MNDLLTLRFRVDTITLGSGGATLNGAILTGEDASASPTPGLPAGRGQIGVNVPVPLESGRNLSPGVEYDLVLREPVKDVKGSDTSITT